MRVGIVALLQESNTFLSGHTTLTHFQEDLLLEGEAVRQQLAPAHHETGGFFSGLAAHAIEAVPIFAARALPFGVMTADTFTQLLRRMDAALDAAGALDGLLVAPHGATVSEEHPDADGYWLSRVRQRFGPALPIIGTLDPHANLSAAMVDACDALIAYRTNPHLDQRQRGLDAAQLMARTLRGEVRPVQAAEFPPLAVNIVAQHTAEPPCRPLYERADALLAQPGVLSNSLLLGFPYADVAEMGAATIVVTDNDRQLARRLARQLADAWWQHRHEFAPRLASVDEAVAQAAALDGPVCLLDMGDNVGGGSPGDGTFIAHALAARRLGPSFVCLADADAASRAAAAGIGAKLALDLGGKTDRLHGEPLPAKVTVRGLTDGRFAESEPRHGGFVAFDQGPTAVLETDWGLTVMVTTRRMVPFSLRQLTSAGVEPESFRVLVAKGVNAPLAAYAPVCRHLLRVDTPGVTSADLTRLDYQRRRRPMFPFELDATY
jgi:microcystin degradation protein MlrC